LPAVRLSNANHRQIKGQAAVTETSEKIAQTMEPIVADLVAILSTYGLSMLGALVVLIIGLWLSGWASRLTRRMLQKNRRIDPTLTQFFSSLVKWAVVAITIVTVLGQFGVQTASLITVLGATGLAIGLALQGTLSDVAAGVMLLLFRPLKVGDYVEAGGNAGTVEELNLFFIVLATPDNVRITVPNGKVWGAAVSNFSANPTRRVDIPTGISYDDDIDAAIKVIKDTISADPRVHGDPEPFVAVSAMSESSIEFAVRVWVDNANFWPVKFDLTRAVKLALDANGITIPYPQRTVHVVKHAE
jgi:small conductance mechanosensitive channel